MRLTSIKLAGFKSFVDPVTVPFDGNMTAIVGPNGCGKSNIIDAVRWVMGESSAKTLRGESMADVIFNGSVGRKPVGQASIELHFDNRDGDMGGVYAQYAEIAVKRIVTRDGQSSYFFNGQKCRRRDIADLFMGTGLGPRSYAIIGQGMIARLIEARPEELRATLEEAAGISKYKERRRETENRMRRTQENLERLDDIREELDKQLERLKRQAEAAKRYQSLKRQEQHCQGELALLRSRALRAQQGAQESQVRELEAAVERELLGARQCETRLEEARLEHDGLSDRLEASQARFYQTTAAIARLEQQLEHSRARVQQLSQELAGAQRELATIDQLGESDGLRLAEIDEQLENLEPAREEAAEHLAELEAALEEAEQQQHEASQRWEAFNEEYRDVSRDAERAQERIASLESGLKTLSADLERRRRQHAELADVAELREQREASAGQLADLDLEQQTLSEQREYQQQRREEARQQSDHAEERRETLRQQRSQWQGELASLDALINAALEDNSETLQQHLHSHGLGESPRLAESLVVEPGWEDAVSWVLAPWLNARLVDLTGLSEVMNDFTGGELALLDRQDAGAQVADSDKSLASRVQGAGPCHLLLTDILIAESATEAWQRCAELMPGQSLLTRDGLWLGPGWARRRAGQEDGGSLLASRRRRDELVAQLAMLTSQLDELEALVEEARESARHAEAALEASRDAEVELQQRRQQRILEEAGLATRLDHLESRSRELDEELDRLVESRETQLLELEEAREGWQEAMAHLEQCSASRESIEHQRREANAHLERLRVRRQPLSERSQQLALDVQRLTTERTGLLQQCERSDEGRTRLVKKCLELEVSRDALGEPEDIELERLETLFEQRETHQQALNACRDQAAGIGERLRNDELERQRHERNLEGVRERLQEARLQVQAFKLKADTQDEQLSELGLDVVELAAQLDPQATESTWQARLESLSEKIRRLGAINLAAIEEYEQQAERRDYLQAQHAELCEALETLGRAIRKIDQETRTRFKQTFDQVDSGLQALFPKIFGGGTAWLTLTGEDLLETGVAIMARPPGKKNSTIHLLSGGEKALTALSLVFAIFQLNPAPFCMLDEVDAPLDDANVGRYAALVKDMSKTVQFIYITHNKIAMQAAERLMGVTMQEPGVSRLVSVGVEEAAALADA